MSGAVCSARRMSILRNRRKGGELTCVLVDGVIWMLQPVLHWWHITWIDRRRTCAYELSLFFPLLPFNSKNFLVPHRWWYRGYLHIIISLIIIIEVIEKQKRISNINRHQWINKYLYYNSTNLLIIVFNKIYLYWHNERTAHTTLKFRS